MKAFGGYLGFLEPFALLASDAFLGFIEECASPAAFRDFLWQTYMYIQYTPQALLNAATHSSESTVVEYLTRHAYEEKTHAPMLLQDILQLADLPGPLGELSPHIQDLVKTSVATTSSDDPVASVFGEMLVLECLPTNRSIVERFLDESGVPNEAGRTILLHCDIDHDHKLSVLDAIPDGINRELLLDRAIYVLRLLRLHWEWMREKHQKTSAFREINNRVFVVPIDDGGAASSVSRGPNWGYSYLGVHKLWTKLGKGELVKLGIADSGMDIGHPAFNHIKNKVRYKAFDTDTGSEINEQIRDSGWHGTHCAGIICGILPDNEDESIGMGIAPYLEELYVARVMDGSSSGTLAVINAIRWFIDQKCDIISLSLGWPGQHEEFASVLHECAEKKIAVVAASGNEYGKTSYSGGRWTRSPGNYPSELVLSVGAIMQDSSIWNRSGGGDIQWQDGIFPNSPVSVMIPRVAAPGVQIISAGTDGDYYISDGTSMATPHIAGLLALVLSYLRRHDHKAEAQDASKILLISTLDKGDPGPDVRYGQGIISTAKLLSNLGIPG